MSHAKTEVSPAQMYFNAGIMEHPLATMGVESEVIDLILKDKHWLEITTGRAAVVDTASGFAAFVHPATLAVDKMATHITLPGEQRLGGVAITTSSLSLEQTTAQMFAVYKDPIIEGGTFLVVEKTLQKPTQKHDELLRIAGFVHAGVSRQDEYLVWHAKKRKEAHHKPVNIWSSPKIGNLAHNFLEANLNFYQLAGFTYIDSSPIEERAAQSHFASRDLSMIKEGYGVQMVAPCGCIMLHDYVGDWLVEGEVMCNGVHEGLEEAKRLFMSEHQAHFGEKDIEFKSEIPVLRVPPPEEEVLGNHGDCGGQLKRVSHELGPKRHRGQLFIRYQSDILCTSCGDFDPDATRFVDVIPSVH